MRHVLIVDDNQTFLYAARELIIRQDPAFLVDTAADGEEALLAIRRHDYDVIISDIRLPGLQGLELLEGCQSLRPGTPVVLITGDGDRELEEEAARRGAYAFLHKPVVADTFCSVVNRAVVQTDLRRQPNQVLGIESLCYMQATEQMRRRSKAITEQLDQVLKHDDSSIIETWARQEAETIVTAFLDYEGSDDLLQLQDLISRALCRAYETGKTRPSALGLSDTHRMGEIGPDAVP